MPIYEYECPKCGKFDVIQKASEKPLKKNPECTKMDCPCTAQRLISASSFHLKGSGWYKTDYKSSGTAGTASSTSASSSSDSSDASSSTSSSSGDEGKSKKKKSLKTSGGCGSGCGCH